MVVAPSRRNSFVKCPRARSVAQEWQLICRLSCPFSNSSRLTIQTSEPDKQPPLNAAARLSQRGWMLPDDDVNLEKKGREIWEGTEKALSLRIPSWLIDKNRLHIAVKCGFAICFCFIINKSLEARCSGIIRLIGLRIGMYTLRLD